MALTCPLGVPLIFCPGWRQGNECLCTHRFARLLALTPSEMNVLHVCQRAESLAIRLVWLVHLAVMARRQGNVTDLTGICAHRLCCFGAVFPLPGFELFVDAIDIKLMNNGHGTGHLRSPMAGAVCPRQRRVRAKGRLSVVRWVCCLLFFLRLAAPLDVATDWVSLQTGSLAGPWLSCLWSWRGPFFAPLSSFYAVGSSGADACLRLWLQRTPGCPRVACA